MDVTSVEGELQFRKGKGVQATVLRLFLTTRREMVHYRQEENPFVKILLTQNKYRLESNVFLSSQKIKFWG